MVKKIKKNIISEAFKFLLSKISFIFAITVIFLLIINVIKSKPIMKHKPHEVFHESVYQFENDSLLQVCRLSNKSDTSIIFKITVVNKLRNEKDEIEGVAQGTNNLSLGTDHFGGEENGNDLLIFEYYYNGKCSIQIKIEAETGHEKFLKVKEFECKEYHHDYCPFQSVGTMHRISKKK